MSLMGITKTGRFPHSRSRDRFPNQWEQRRRSFEPPSDWLPARSSASFVLIGHWKSGHATSIQEGRGEWVVRRHSKLNYSQELVFYGVIFVSELCSSSRQTNPVRVAVPTGTEGQEYRRRVPANRPCCQKGAVHARPVQLHDDQSGCQANLSVLREQNWPAPLLQIRYHQQSEPETCQFRLTTPSHQCQ